MDKGMTMRLIVGALLVSVAVSAGTSGQTAARPFAAARGLTATQSELALQREATAKSNKAEHQAELDSLHLTATRPGVSGSPSAPNAANYDETLATVTDANLLQPGTLPAVLQFADGSPVLTAIDWSRRRKELLEMFDRVEYGATPAKTPLVTWQEISSVNEVRKVAKAGDVTSNLPVQVKRVVGVLAHPNDLSIVVKIELTVVTPVAAKKRVPVVMEFHWDLPAAMLSQMSKEIRPSWQEQVLARGWGYAEYSPYSVQPDSAAGLTSGVIGLVNHGQQRSLADWGALKAWGWGASRALDYLATQPHVDASRVALEGHSRFGKAVLVAMAYDPRFAIAFVSSSGAGGANLWRRNVGEQLENVESPSEFHWMAGNFLKYAADPLHAKDLPLDQHELIALSAPRPVLVSGGSAGDLWQDPHGMFLAAVAASPVYALLGKKGIASATGAVTRFPAIETPLVAGELAYRQHTGGHTPGPNWPTFLDFAERYF